MAAIISIGSLKTAGTTTLALALAGAAAAARSSVSLIDASEDADLLRWSNMAGRPEAITVVRAEEAGDIEKRVRAQSRKSDIIIIDAGRRRAFIEAGARAADRALVPLRLSPLSAVAAVATDAILAADAAGGRRGRDRRLVATGLAPIPSRIARLVEQQVDTCETERLVVGLALRAAFEAPFLFGGTVHSLGDETAPGLEKARANAEIVARAAGLVIEAKVAAAPRRAAKSAA